MNKLYYAKFESGLGETVKLIIKKHDKNARIKALFDDAVLFFADEHFKFQNLCFSEAFVVIHNSHKTGVGAANFEIKQLLEKKDLKISLPKTANDFKLSVLSENTKTVVDEKLKNALVVTLKKITRRQVSFHSKNEFLLITKQSGDNLFMRRLDLGNSYAIVQKKFEILPEVAYTLNFVSNPSKNEVMLDPFPNSGIICYVRALAFEKANVIAASGDKEIVDSLKKTSKLLKQNKFSVLAHDFFDDDFPIRFIDKIVSDISNEFDQEDVFEKLIKKAYELKVKVLCLTTRNMFNDSETIKNKYKKTREVILSKFKICRYDIEK